MIGGKLNTEKKYVITPIKLCVHMKKANPIFGEQVTYVSLDDEAAGPFIVLEQDNEDVQGISKIKLDFDEIPMLLKAIEQLQKAAEIFESI